LSRSALINLEGEREMTKTLNQYRSVSGASRTRGRSAEDKTVTYDD
jgi:hypothetical protein